MSGDVDVQAAELARLIKRAAAGRGWCHTAPLQIAKYLLTQGVVLPAVEPEEVNR